MFKVSKETSQSHRRIFLWIEEALAIRRVFSLVDMITNTKFSNCNLVFKRTSDGGNGNHSVSLPIILIKYKVDQKFPSSYISVLDFLFP